MQITKEEVIEIAKSVKSKNGNTLYPDWWNTDNYIDMLFDFANLICKQKVKDQNIELPSSTNDTFLNYEKEAFAWRIRFPSYRYRPQDECIELIQTDNSGPIFTGGR